MDSPSLMVFLPLLIFALMSCAVLLGHPRPPACPECGTGQSIGISPLRKTRRMWFERGYLCPNCGCEADMQGRRVAPGTPARPEAVRGRIVVWASAGASFAACLLIVALAPLLAAPPRPSVAPPPITLPEPAPEPPAPRLGC